MSYTYQELKKMTVAKLKEVSYVMDHEAVRGYTQLNKDHLLHAICQALNLDEHVHHDVVGVDKSTIKKQIKALKVDRNKALEAHDSVQLKTVRREIKKLKNKLQRATV